MSIIELFQIQFTTALILGINGIRSGCDFPLWMQYALVIYMLSFIVLFGNFYAKAYIEKVSLLLILIIIKISIILIYYIKNNYNNCSINELLK